MLELVIALAIGVVVTSAAISLYRIQRDAFDTINEQARLADAAASALAVLGAHIRLAGYRGTKSGVAPFSAGSARRANAGMASLGQSTGAAAALFGCHAGRPVGPLGAERCERIDGQSDGLQVRYRADTIATWRSSDGRATDCLGQGITVTAEKTEPWVVNRFFARYSPSSGKPELYCEGSGRLGVAQPLVEGIERLQLSYWIAGARAPLDST